MSSRVLLRTVLREHVAAYVLASLADILLLVVLFQLDSKADLQFDVVGLVGLHEGLLAILILGVVFSGIARWGWRWQYVTMSILFSGYVGYRLAARFVATVEIAGQLEMTGVAVSNYFGLFYLLALGSAVCYVVMILTLRRAYGRLVSTRKVRDC